MKQLARLYRRLCLHAKGFSLIEMSILLVIVSVIVAGLLSVNASKESRTKRENISDEMLVIQQALANYVTANSYLPCVASRTAKQTDANFGDAIMADCTASTTAPAGTARTETTGGSGVYMRIGALPVRDLYLSDDYATDTYGQYYSYVVIENLTASGTYAATAGVLSVQDASGTDILTDSGYIVFAHGKNGKGSYLTSSGAASPTTCSGSELDVENCDFDAIYRKADLQLNTRTGNSYFDDQVIYLAKASTGAPVPDAVVFNGISGMDYVGYATASGDFNGDGVDDLIIGAYNGDPNGSNSGEAYVVYGSSSSPLSGTIELSTDADATINGFDAGDFLGNAVASGDINGDGVDDLIIAAEGAASNIRGQTYIIYGSSVSPLSGTHDIDAIADATFTGISISDRSGYRLVTGNVNGDTNGANPIDDLIISTFSGDSVGADSGEMYIVYGDNVSPPSGTVSLLTGADVQINAQGSNDRAGHALAIGDIDGDGTDDLIIGAPGENPRGGLSGATYIVYGSGSLSNPTSLHSADAKFNGIASDDESGYAVASGDIDGDGYDDVIIGAYKADPNGGLSGETYIVYGDSVSPPSGTIDLSTGADVTLNGIGGGDYSGKALATGDINGDTVDDVIIAASYGDPNGNSSSGETYIVYGSSSSPLSGTIELSASADITLNGIDAIDSSGNAVSSGDINNDGVDDVIIGAYLADPNGFNSGETYVVYGKPALSGSTNISDLLAP